MSNNSFKLNIQANDLAEHIKVLKEEQASILKSTNDYLEESALANNRLQSLLLDIKFKTGELLALKEKIVQERISREIEASDIKSKKEQLDSDLLAFKNYKKDTLTLIEQREAACVEKEKTTESVVNKLNNEISGLSITVSELSKRVQFMANEELETRKRLDNAQSDFRAFVEMSAKTSNELDLEISEKKSELSRILSDIQDKESVYRSKTETLDSRENQLDTKEKNLRIMSSRLERQVQQFLPGYTIKL